MDREKERERERERGQTHKQKKQTLQVIMCLISTLNIVINYIVVWFGLSVCFFIASLRF